MNVHIVVVGTGSDIDIEVPSKCHRSAIEVPSKYQYINTSIHQYINTSIHQYVTYHAQQVAVDGMVNGDGDVVGFHRHPQRQPIHVFAVGAPRVPDHPSHRKKR
jgi:hypothetical protein